MQRKSTINGQVRQINMDETKAQQHPAEEGKRTRKEGSSPRWSATTKLIVGLTLVAMLAGLLIGYKSIVGPLLLAFMIAYLLQPLADGLRHRLHCSWRTAVNLLYLVVLVLLLGLLTWGGIALVEQASSLVTFLQKGIANLPQLLNDLAAQPLKFGPFEIPVETTSLANLANQALGVVQPVLSRLGGVITSLASGAATTVGWMFFMLLVSYFMLAESGGLREDLFSIQIPGYEYDLKRMGVELSRIWNAFLRGQMIIILITVAVYSVLLGGLGVRYFYGLALLAGLARFVPYVGPAVAWTAYGLVAFFQGWTIFGISPIVYALVVVGVAWVTDVILDNMVVPRLLADTLRVHPAAVMVAALVAARLLGIVGVVLAAPVVATGKLLVEYALRKLADRDPWEGIVTPPPPPRFSNVIGGIREQWTNRARALRERMRKPKE